MGGVTTCLVGCIIITISGNQARRLHDNHPLPAPKNHLLHQQQDPTKSDPEDSSSASASSGEFVATVIGEDLLIDDPDFHWLAEAAFAILYPRQPIYAGGGGSERIQHGGFRDLGKCALVFRLVNPVKTEETIRQCGMRTVPCVGQAR